MAMGDIAAKDYEPTFEYVRPVRPVVFPVEAEVPESLLHLELRTALYQLLSFFLEGSAAVGSDQFIYFDARDPKACTAPDVYVKLGGPQKDIRSWKTWERGTPELAVEIVSPADAPTEAWQSKLSRYHRLGVRELVRFEPQAPRIRVWDYVDGDLVERRAAPGAAVYCRVLRLWWTVLDDRCGPTLRLARDAEGRELIKNEVETLAEARQQEAEARQQEAEARRAAEQRVSELTAELERLRRG